MLLAFAVIAGGCANSTTPADRRSDASGARDGGSTTGTDAGPGGGATDSGEPSVDGGDPTMSPRYLHCGRVYDQELEYFATTGDVHPVMLLHHDDTSMPASEGGAVCNVRPFCNEQVTRIEDGATLSGVFTFMQTFNIQVASEEDPGVGSFRLTVDSMVIVPWTNMSGSGTAGFNNFPVPTWMVPDAGEHRFTIEATGGFVDVRAVTPVCRTSTGGGPPTVDLKVNGSDGTIMLGAPAHYTLTWTATEAATCEGSGAWMGGRPLVGTETKTGVPIGTYVYTLSCSNAAGAAEDAVTVRVGTGPG